MPSRLCLEPGCPHPASPTGRGRCPTHTTQRNQQTRSPFKHIYNSKRWQLTRRAKLANTPLCESCGTIAEHVHHIIDLREGGDPWAMSNLQALCAACHNKTTRARQHAA